MRVRYIGSDDPTDNAECAAFGRTWTKGEWVEMADVPPRLLTNWTFEADSSDDDNAADDPAALATLKVADLKAIAAKRGVDLGDAVKKADIIAAIELHAEALPQE